MKRKLSILLVLAMLLNMFGAFAVTSTAQDLQTGEKPDSLKVLIIASSFGRNSIWHMGDIARDMGIEDYHFVSLFRTAATLDVHWQLAQSGDTGYLFNECSDEQPSWSTKNNVSVDYGLLLDDWDYIVIQQSAEQSANAGTYNSDNKSLINFANYVDSKKTNPDCKIAFNMVWSFKDGSVIQEAHMGRQDTMFYSIVSATRTQVLTNPQIDLVLPAGTAIQNARGSLMGNIFNADTMHLNDLGQTVVGYVWYRALTGGASIENASYLPSAYADMKDTYMPAIIDAVNKAYENPYYVSKSAYPPADATAEPTLIPASGPDENGKMTRMYIDEDFEDYASIDDVMAKWTLNTKATTSPEAVATNVPYATLVEETDGNTYLNLPSSGSASYYFDSVFPVNYHGGPSYGRNAELVLEFDGYMGTKSGASQSYFKLDGPTYLNASGNTKQGSAVSIGRRGGGSLRYANNIGSSSSALVISSSMNRFTKVKFVIHLTDDNGEWYQVSTPKVDIYYGDMTTPFATGRGMVNSYTDYLTRFNVGGACPTAIDNLKVYVTTDSDSVPTQAPTEAPSATPVPDKAALAQIIADATALYNTASANVGDGVGQYPQAKVTALNAAIAQATEVNADADAWQGLIDAKVAFVQKKMDATVANTEAPTSAPSETATPVPTQAPTQAPDATPTPLPVKTDLSDALDVAAELKTNMGANLGDQAGQYSQALFTALVAAMDEAYAVMSDPSASQTKIDATCEALLNAVNAAKVTNSPTPVPPVTDKSALEAKLEEAEALYETASNNMGEAAGQYTENTVAALSTAIEEAAAIYEDLFSEQNVIDDATDALTMAIARCVPVGVATPTPTPWDGTTVTEPQTDAEGTYLISNGAELAGFKAIVDAGAVDANAKVVDNINLGDKVFAGIGSSTYKYSGTFDGNGHTVIGVNNTLIDASGVKGYGFFNYTNGATIKDLGVEGKIHITSATSKATTKNRTALSAGGIVGTAYGATKVSGCYFDGIVYAHSSNGYRTTYGVGGIVGITYSSDVVIENCYAKGKITVSGTTNLQSSGTALPAGGILGSSVTYSSTGARAYYAPTIKNCFSTAEVIANPATSKRNFIGPIVAENVETAGWTNKPVVINCAWLDNDTSNWKSSKGVNYYDIAYGIEKSEAQFASGNVAKYLGSAFKQGELTPVLAWQGGRTVDSTVDKSAINTAISSATSAYAGMSVGDGEGQYSQATASALNAAIVAAQAVADNNEAAQADCDNAEYALLKATAKLTADVNGPVPTLVPANLETETLLNDNFDSYADTTAVQNAGWTLSVNSSASKISLGSKGGTDKYLNSSSFQGNVLRTFEPVDLTVGGKKNAMVVYEVSVYHNLYGETTANRSHRWSIGSYDTAYTIGAAASQSGPNTGDGYTYSTNSTYNDTTVIKPYNANWVKGDLNTLTTDWTDLRFEIQYTDETGAVITPVVRTYYRTSGDNYWIPAGENRALASVTSLNAVRMFGETASLNKPAMDNVSVTLAYTKDEEPTPTPEPTPVPVDKTALSDALASAQELYDNASANVGDAEGQYSQALVTALNVAIETAKAVYDNAEADQATVDQAIVDLNAVVATVVPNTATPTPEPTEEPTPEPTEEPTPAPTEEPTPEPTPEPTTPPAADVAYGDADGNGEVAVEDATAILRFKAGLLAEADINLENADADGNGEVAVEDATAILRYKAGLLANLGPQA